MAETQRQLAAAQVTGTASLEELQRQREVLQHAQGTLEEANADLDTAESSITHLGGGLRAWAQWMGFSRNP